MTSDDKSFLDALKPDVTIEGVERSGALNATELLASLGWFENRRKKLLSAGGRPTNPEWTIKRQIPFSCGTWETIKALAGEMSAAGRKVAPAQVAAFLLEDAVTVPSTIQPCLSGRARHHTRSQITDDRFREWEMPELF